jgi:hypothetical protein
VSLPAIKKLIKMSFSLIRKRKKGEIKREKSGRAGE